MTIPYAFFRGISSERRAALKSMVHDLDLEGLDVKDDAGDPRCKALQAALVDLNAWDIVLKEGYWSWDDVCNDLSEALEVAETADQEAVGQKDSRDEIIYALTAAAGRCEAIGQREASAEQIAYLADLLERSSHDLKWAGFPVTNTSAALTSRKASEIINLLKQ